MKRLVLALAILAVPAWGQYKPPASTGYCYYAAGSMWIPMAATGGTISLPPPSISLYGVNGTTPSAVLCDANGNLIVGQLSLTSKSDNTNYYLTFVAANSSTSQGVDVGPATYNPSTNTTSMNTSGNAVTATYATSAGTATDSTKLPLAGGTMTGTLNGTNANYSGTVAAGTSVTAPNLIYNAPSGAQNVTQPANTNFEIDTSGNGKAVVSGGLNGQLTIDGGNGLELCNPYNLGSQNCPLIWPAANSRLTQFSVFGLDFDSGMSLNTDTVAPSLWLAGGLYPEKDNAEDLGGCQVYPRPADYGAGGDGQDLTFSGLYSGACPGTNYYLAPQTYTGRGTNDAVVSLSAPTHLHSETANFVSGDVGAGIAISGAGTNNVGTLVTTIASVTDSKNIVLTSGASTAVSAAPMAIGITGTFNWGHTIAANTNTGVAFTIGTPVTLDTGESITFYPNLATDSLFLTTTYQGIVTHRWRTVIANTSMISPLFQTTGTGGAFITSGNGGAYTSFSQNIISPTTNEGDQATALLLENAANTGTGFRFDSLHLGVAVGPGSGSYYSLTAAKPFAVVGNNADVYMNIDPNGASHNAGIVLNPTGGSGANYWDMVSNYNGPFSIDSNTVNNVILATQAGAVTLYGPVTVGTTRFTVSGCGTAGSVTGSGTAGSFTVGTGTLNCTFTVTLNGSTGLTATHGWVANADDTTAEIHCMNSTTVSTTTVVFTCMGQIGTSDLIIFTAWAY